MEFGQLQGAKTVDLEHGNASSEKSHSVQLTAPNGVHSELTLFSLTITN